MNLEKKGKLVKLAPKSSQKRNAPRFASYVSCGI